VLNLRAAKIKRSPTGDRHPAASFAEQHFPASSKMHADLVLRHHPAGYDVTAVLKISCWDRHDYVFSV